MSDDKSDLYVGLGCGFGAIALAIAFAIVLWAMHTYLPK